MKLGEELKVNIIIIKNGSRAFIGVQATDCDPKMMTLQGDLRAALEVIPTFVEEADLQWSAAPRNPKSTIPEPVAPARTATSTPARAAATASSKPAAPKAQPNMF